jgi:hypothetical protein
MLVFAIAVPAAAQYCPSGGTGINCANADEYISNVTIGTLNNASTCVGPPGYEDFTALPGPTVFQAALTPIAVTVGNWYSLDQVRVFCDWNGDNLLTAANEVTILVNGGTNVYSGAILAPVGAAASTRMRVVLTWNTVPIPCATLTWGNTEDYTINTNPPTGLVGTGASNPAVVAQGASALLTVAVSAVAPPIPPTGVAVTADLASMGGSATQPLYDDGSNGDQVPNDLVFSYDFPVPAATPAATYVAAWTATDSVPRTATGAITVQVVPSNDACGNPVQLALGVNGPYTNAGATDSGAVASCPVGGGFKDLWFFFVPSCSGSLDVATPCTGFDTTLTAYDTCGGNELACNDQDPAGCGNGSRITFAVTSGMAYLIRVASFSTTATGSFTITTSYGAMGLAYSSPMGAGSIQLDITNGPLNGGYFLALTFLAGAFPNGWLFGVDIPLGELNILIATGPPFLGTLDACGAFTLGPLSAPNVSGSPFYSVALGLPPGLYTPIKVSPPVTYTVP